MKKQAPKGACFFRAARASPHLVCQIYFTSVTGTSALCITRCATEPMTNDAIALRPRVPITMEEQPLLFAYALISVAGEPKATASW